MKSMRWIGSLACVGILSGLAFAGVKLSPCGGDVIDHEDNENPAAEFTVCNSGNSLVVKFGGTTDIFFSWNSFLGRYDQVGGPIWISVRNTATDGFDWDFDSNDPTVDFGHFDL